MEYGRADVREGGVGRENAFQARFEFLRGKRKSIKEAEVRLYQREGDAPCCGTNPPHAKAVTNRVGIFEFKNIAPGKYWLVIVTEAKQYSRAVTYTPDAKNKEPIVCSDLLYDLSGGELQLGRMIHVD